MRHAYQLLPPNEDKIELIHYFGDEKVATPYLHVHGNVKTERDRPYHLLDGCHIYVTFVAIAQDGCHIYVTRATLPPGRMPHICDMQNAVDISAYF